MSVVGIECVHTLLSRLRFPPFTKATAEGSVGGDCLGCSLGAIVVERRESLTRSNVRQEQKSDQMSTTWYRHTELRESENTPEMNAFGTVA